VVLRGERDGGEHRLVAQLGEEEREGGGEDGRATRPVGLLLLVAGQVVAPEGPQPEHEEGHGGGEADPERRQGGPEQVADPDGDGVDHGGRGRDPE
jgi:hypothetical protein